MARLHAVCTAPEGDADMRGLQPSVPPYCRVLQLAVRW